MGFDGKKTLHLTFVDDPDLKGLEVTVRRPSFGQVLKATKRSEELGDDDAATTRATAELLCELLVEWNLEEDGKPVPHDVDALYDLDYSVVKAIISAWEENTFRVSGPKEPSSDDGPQSVVASIPMEPLSESRAS